MNNADGTTTCALCGHRFTPSEAHCASCPLGKSCRVICCPHCGYQTVDETKTRETIQKIRRLFSWRKKNTKTKS